MITDGLLLEAQATATRAAQNAAVEVRNLDDVDQIAAAGALFDEVWNAPNVVPTNLLRAVSHAGGYLSGAFREGAMVGASLGFLGHDESTLFLHSHVTATAPAVQGAGIGKALKLHQRMWSLERSLTQVRWTFDPLVRTNAYFNLMRLGAEIYGYEANFYGLMPDGLNQGDESDRCFVVWSLDSDRCVSVVTGSRTTIDEKTIPEGALVMLGDADGRPFVGGDPGDDVHQVLCRVPQDIVSIRRADPALALEWRRSVRATFGKLLRSGWIVPAITRDGWYLVQRERRRRPRATVS